ncbi:helix-turn-helix domain-containing protein [Chitinophaga horti]|uniref:Helix-turn-helix domain-containing protein n=1 Tax=Chitinophaga horti TaxID=2920382 RepID=A0ABY6J0Y7_9BACT|nr:helix-turn-helix domain-containing protein [Chitinophaga horti]UYQ93190.1 helix-turn-helix domain-containing protein [Chitinophaga horti]
MPLVLHEFTPSARLQNLIRVYRVINFKFERHLTIPPKPYPPRPEHCLSFYPRDTETAQYAHSGTTYEKIPVVLFGIQHEVSQRFVGHDFLLFQVVFRPGALYRITGIPSHELANCYLDATTIFNTNELKEVNEKLAATDNFREMINIVERLLGNMKVCKDEHPMDTIGNLVLTADKPLSIDWLAKESCLSLRQYERKFLDRMGASPKYFQKVVRFENAFRMKNRYPQLDWLTIAVHCGYHDYQHLVKDYKTITGQTPRDFHLLDLSAPERVFGDADTY